MGRIDQMPALTTNGLNAAAIDVGERHAAGFTIAATHQADKIGGIDAN